MNKKIIVFCALLSTYSGYSFDPTPWLEVKPSYFLFFDSVMSEIYNKGGFQVQGSASIPFRNYFDWYGSVGYRQSWGHALNTCEKTNLIVVPIDFGIKPIFDLHNNVDAFFAIGPRVFYLHQHNNSAYVDCNINAWGIGCFVNAGLNFLFKNAFLFGIFAECSYESKTICPCMHNVYSGGSMQIGGFACGISLGYAV